MGESIIQRAFAGGELAPSLHARADLQKYQTGLRTCRNFMVLKEGGIANRGGLRFIQACKTTSATVQLIPYVSEVSGESMLLELGNGYVRFFMNGAALTVTIADLDAWDIATNYVQGDVVQSGGAAFYAIIDHTAHATSDPLYWHPFAGNIYEVPTPFAHRMNYVQSGRTITLTHKDEPPFDLVQENPTRWLLLPVLTTPLLPAPSTPTVTPATSGSRTLAYVVTAGATDSLEESEASGQGIALSSGEPTADDPTLVEWTAVAGASSYFVYKDPYANGVYGYLGMADGQLEFHDSGQEPDFALTPPVSVDLFDAEDGYPHCCAYHQQRRLFAYTNDIPDSVWGSRTGFVSNFSISTPLQDDDAITFRLAGNNHNPVRHMIALKAGLVLLTDTGEWTIRGGEGKAITPSDILPEQETYVGANDARPVVIGNSICYVQARGHILRDLRFDQQVEGLGGRDLSIFAAHLFKGSTLRAIAYQQEPDSIIWAARSDGALLGLTYLRDQDVWGWHRHDTGASGRVEEVCVVPEGDEDALYVIVRRTINSATVRYIERLMRRPDNDSTYTADLIFLDSSLSYSGAPVASVGGMQHLNGQTVAIVADGVILPTQVMPAGGTIALGASYSNVHVGLPIVADFETLDLDVHGSSVRDKKKRVGQVVLLLHESSRGYLVGPDSAHLTRNGVTPWSVATRYTGPEEQSIVAEWNDAGRIFVRHDQPLPLTVLGAIPNVTVGG